MSEHPIGISDISLYVPHPEIDISTITKERIQKKPDLEKSLLRATGTAGQTNLRFPEQRRVFRMIPGLAQAKFARYGQMHRNTFVNAPKLLEPSLAWRGRSDLFLAGQITGVEGYLGNIATGLLAGINLVHAITREPPLILPEVTMLGALCHYVTHADPGQFQPMKANLGLLPSLPPGGPKRNRRQRAQAHADRAQRALELVLSERRDILRIAT